MPRDLPLQTVMMTPHEPASLTGHDLVLLLMALGPPQLDRVAAADWISDGITDSLDVDSKNEAGAAEAALWQEADG